MTDTCPKCGSRMEERTTKTGALFLVCSTWPKCKVSGTPELLSMMVRRPDGFRSEPVRIGELASPLAELRILQSKMNQAKTDEERDVIREQYHSVMNAT